METRELNISIPEGFEIDKEKSTFEHIIFKPVEQNRWRDNPENTISGYWIQSNSTIRTAVGHNTPGNYNIFTTKKQAESALAMARISQIIANDKRFGGPITDEEWKNESIPKYCLKRTENNIIKYRSLVTYMFLAFHTEKQRDLFLEENEDLVKQYLML